MLQLVVFVPRAHKEKVKKAMFEAGGGKIGNYDSCCFENLGLGQFRPLKGSQPFLGQLNEVEEVEEVRIEMSCENHLVLEVFEAMKKAHPYEAPAYYATETLKL